MEKWDTVRTARRSTSTSAAGCSQRSAAADVLLDAGRIQEARDLLAQVTAEIDEIIESPRGKTVSLKKPE